MESKQTCQNKACNKTEMVEKEDESTWTYRRFICPNCGSHRNIPSNVGKLAQMAPAMIAVALTASTVSSLFGGVLDFDPTDFVD